MVTVVKDSNGREYVGYPTRNREMFFHKETPQGVIQALIGAYHQDSRIRVFYGDQQTGADWGEEHDTMGRVGKSTGHISIPLMIHNTRSMGGGSILDHCIVKITVDKRVVYQHPTYCNFEFKVQKGAPNKAGEWYVYRKHPITGVVENCATFKTEEKANRWVAFMLGISNKK